MHVLSTLYLFEILHKSIPKSDPLPSTLCCVHCSCALSIAPLRSRRHCRHAFPINPNHQHNWYHLVVALWQRKSNRLNDKQINLQECKYVANRKHLDVHWKKCFRCHICHQMPFYPAVHCSKCRLGQTFKDCIVRLRYVQLATRGSSFPESRAVFNCWDEDIDYNIQVTFSISMGTMAFKQHMHCKKCHSRFKTNYYIFKHNFA